MARQLLQIVCLISVVCAGQNTPEVTISQGTLRGSYWTTWKGRTFSAFTSIPYAKPPLNDLRFKAPVPAEPWQGVLDASQFHPLCPQIDILYNDMVVKGEEDCLFLNVYVPQMDANNTEPLPVMFFIHGGGFFSGSANADFYGPHILLDQDVVMVTTNYRLGALGFLSTEDAVVPGNNGLKDQNLALRWTKSNIIHFGGDPQRITVFGQSAGGASAHYQVLSPLSRDLLFAGISQSGIALAPWVLESKGQAVKNAERLAGFLNCSTISHDEMVNCLRNFSAHDIVEQDYKFMEWGYDPSIPFKPVIEINHKEAFLTEHPMDIITSGNAAPVPFMTGFTTDDGAMKSAGIYNFSNLVEDLNNEFNRVIPMVFQYHILDPVVQDNISNAIRSFYLGDRDIDDSTKSEITDMITDGWFLSPQDIAATLQAQYSKHPVYSYVFGYHGSVSFGPLFGDPSHDYGVVHCDELIYLLSTEDHVGYIPTEADKKMNDIMTTLWANFARTGNPTPETSTLALAKWEPVNATDLQYYFIRNDDIGMIRSPYVERSEFWKNLPIKPRNDV